MKDSRILTEWIDSSGNKISLGNTAITATGTYKNKFKNITDQVATAYNWCEIENLTDKTLELSFGTGRLAYQLSISMKNDCFDILYQELNPDPQTIGELTCTSWKQVLVYLENIHLVYNRRVCETTGLSTIDGFKLYENLWD